MAEQLTNYQNNTSYRRAGILIITVGIIILLLTRSFVKNHLAGPDWLWPLILFSCILVVAVTIVKSPIFSPVMAILILLALFSYIAGNDTFRKITGLVCISFGVLLIYRVIAGSFLSKT